MFNPTKQRREEKLTSSVSDEAMVGIITISTNCPLSQQHKTKHPATLKQVDQTIHDVKTKET